MEGILARSPRPKAVGEKEEVSEAEEEGGWASSEDGDGTAGDGPSERDG